MKTHNRVDDPDSENEVVTGAIPIAGHWGHSSGKGLEWEWTRLKALDKSNDDGLQLQLWGKKYGGLMQQAVVSFQCDASRTGNDDAGKEKKHRRDDEDDEDDDDDQSGKDLQYVSYKDEETDDGIAKVLRLTWKTMYACEDYVDGGSGGDASSGWGFFTWFILM